MTDPLRAEIERIASKWEKDAEKMLGALGSPGFRTELGATFATTWAKLDNEHAADLRAALRSTGSPEPEGGGRTNGKEEDK